MVFRARDEQVARTALAEGHRLLMAAINDEPFGDGRAGGRGSGARQGRRLLPRPQHRRHRGGRHRPAHPAHPPERRQPGAAGLRRRQRRIWTAETDLTSAIAEGIARDKDLTKSLLATCGVPVPEGQVVGSAADAWEAAQDIGLPVVVKPTDGNHGRGVSLDLNTQEEVEAAFARGRAAGQRSDRRALRARPRAPAAGGRRPGGGGRTRRSRLGHRRRPRPRWRELIDAQLNTDPRRGTTEDLPARARSNSATDGAIALDLQRQGLSPDGVPAAGRAVLIQRNGNVAIDCTDEVHPEVAHIVSLAARVVGLDIAGIDVVAEDISRPLHAQGGAIVEVNAGPGLLMHLKPAEGAPRPVGRAIVDHLFPEPPKRPQHHRRRPHSRSSASPARAGTHAHRAAGGLAAAAGGPPHRAWPAATACSSTAAASRPATARTGKPASAC